MPSVSWMGLVTSVPTLLAVGSAPLEQVHDLGDGPHVTQPQLVVGDLGGGVARCELLVELGPGAPLALDAAVDRVLVGEHHRIAVDTDVATGGGAVHDRRAQP